VTKLQLLHKKIAL